MTDRLNVFIGFDRREPEAFYVAAKSLCDKSSIPLRVHMLHETNLRATGLYTRSYHIEERKDAEGILRPVRIDAVDQRPFSTDFAFTRFLVPALMDYRGWALFFDCDFLFRTDVAKLLVDHADPKNPVACVKHSHEPPEGVKMDAQLQQRYRCKNWSSFMLFNCSHPYLRRLTPTVVNTWTGQELHAFDWLPNWGHIGEIDERWNWLVGHSPTTVDGLCLVRASEPGEDGAPNFAEPVSPFAVHFTDGGPWFPAYRDVPYALEWEAVRNTLTVTP